MYLAYIDESGSSGDIAKGASLTYTLGCVLVTSARWKKVLDGLIGYRRYLKDRFGVPVRAEVKANYLIRNAGVFRGLGLSEQARHSIYRGSMRLCPKLGIHAFGIVIKKQHVYSGDPHDYAWTFLMQRLERLTRDDTQVLIVHDEGNDARVRAIARRARRAGIAGSAFGTGYIKVPFSSLVEDPVSRKSHESLFLQVADMVAYSAFRRVYPPPQRKVNIVPTLMWDELGAARLSAVNQRSGGPSPGIVSWPKP